MLDGFRSVDKIILRVDRFQSVWRSSKVLAQNYPDFFEPEVESRLKTLYQWRCFVHQLTKCVDTVVAQLGVGDSSSVVAELYPRVSTNSSTHIHRLSVIYSPNEEEVLHTLDSSSDPDDVSSPEAAGDQNNW